MRGYQKQELVQESNQTNRHLGQEQANQRAPQQVQVMELQTIHLGQVTLHQIQKHLGQALELQMVLELVHQMVPVQVPQTYCRQKQGQVKVIQKNFQSHQGPERGHQMQELVLRHRTIH